MTRSDKNINCMKYFIKRYDGVNKLQLAKNGEAVLANNCHHRGGMASTRGRPILFEGWAMQDPNYRQS